MASSARLLCSPTLFSPLLQQCDVHYEEQWHEEARDQYEWETSHQPRVVKRAKQDCIKEIGDAKQVPEEKHSREAKSIICRHARSHPGGRYRHNDVPESSGPCETTRQYPFDIGHQEPQSYESPPIHRYEKDRRNRGHASTPARPDALGHEKQKNWSGESQSHSHRRLIRADECATFREPTDRA